MSYNMPGCIYHANVSYICKYQSKKKIIEKMSNQDEPSKNQDEPSKNQDEPSEEDNNIQYMSELNKYEIDHAKWMKEKNKYMEELNNYSVTRHCTSDTGNKACAILDDNLINYGNSSECCISSDETGKCIFIGHTPVCKWSDNYINNRINQWMRFPSNLEPIKPIDPRL